MQPRMILIFPSSCCHLPSPVLRGQAFIASPGLYIYGAQSQTQGFVHAGQEFQQLHSVDCSCLCAHFNSLCCLFWSHFMKTKSWSQGTFCDLLQSSPKSWEVAGISSMVFPNSCVCDKPRESYPHEIGSYGSDFYDLKILT